MLSPLRRFLIVANVAIFWQNDQLKEALEAERKGMRKYLNQMHQRNKHVENLEEQVICQSSRVARRVTKEDEA